MQIVLNVLLKYGWLALNLYVFISVLFSLIALLVFSLIFYFSNLSLNWMALILIKLGVSIFFCYYSVLNFNKLFLFEPFLFSSSFSNGTSFDVDHYGVL